MAGAENARKEQISPALRMHGAEERTQYDGM